MWQSPGVLATLSLSTLLLGPPVQRPSDAPLTWNAPTECPSSEEVLARIHALVPDVLADSERARVSATVEIVEAGYQLELVLRAGDDSIHRTLIGSDCEQVSDAVALLVAVLLDPVASASEVQRRRSAADPIASENQPAIEPPAIEPSEPSPPEDPTPASISSTSGEGASDSTPAPPRSRLRRADIRVGLRISGGGGYGPTTAGFADLNASAAVFGGRWRAELGGAWTPFREVRNQDIGGRFDAWRVFARGCFVPKAGPRDRIELPLCPSFEVGQVRGRGLDDLPISLEANLLWVALGLGQGLWFAPLERLALGVDLQLAVPLRGGRFLIETVEIQRITPLAVRGLVGLELRLP